MGRLGVHQRNHAISFNGVRSSSMQFPRLEKTVSGYHFENTFFSDIAVFF